MEIDWSKAPEGATHALCAFGGVLWRRFSVEGDFAWSSRIGWFPQLRAATFDYIPLPASATDEVQEIRHIIANAMMIGGDPAVALVAHGYRKFEIVEEDAQ